MSSDIGVWIGALATLAIYSTLWKENEAFNIAQSLFVGLAAAHALVLGYQNVVQSAWAPIVTEGRYVFIIPIVLGVLLFARFVPSITWASRVSMAFLVGSAAGVTIRGALLSDLKAQLLNTISMSWDSVDNVLFLIMVMCTLGYFFFVERKATAGLQRGIRTVGSYTMMIAFGAALSYTVMARLSLLIGRLQYLFEQWLHIIRT